MAKTSLFNREYIMFKVMLQAIKAVFSILTGTGCNSNQMQCGGNGRQCVSELLACDGVKDCKNGKDEDPAFCDSKQLPVGNLASTYCYVNAEYIII